MRTVNKNIFQSSTCLTQDELIRYHQNKMSESEKHLVEHHLTDCELCIEALEGIALLPDMSSLKKASEEINLKYSTKPVEGKLFQNSKVWYAAASVIVLFAFGSVIFNYVEKENNQVSENAAIQKVLNNSDQAVIKEMPQQPNVQEAAIGDTVVKIVSNASRKVADKSYEVAKEYSSERKGQVQSSTNLSATNQLPHGTVVFKDEKIEADKEDAAIGVMSAPVESNDAVTENGILLTKNVSGYKIYNYDFEYKPEKKKELVKQGVPAAYDSKNNMNKSRESTELEKKEISYDGFLSTALYDYKNEKYKTALQKFDVILEQHPNDVNALFYSALAFKEDAQYKKALRYLDKLDEQPNNVFDQESEWHRALIFVEQKENEKAKQLLQKTISKNGFYAEQAKQKMSEIKK